MPPLSQAGRCSVFPPVDPAGIDVTTESTLFLLPEEGGVSVPLSVTAVLPLPTVEDDSLSAGCKPMMADARAR